MLTAQPPASNVQVLSQAATLPSQSRKSLARRADSRWAAPSPRSGPATQALSIRCIKDVQAGEMARLGRGLHQPATTESTRPHLAEGYPP